MTRTDAAIWRELTQQYGAQQYQNMTQHGMTIWRELTQQVCFAA